MTWPEEMAAITAAARAHGLDPAFIAAIRKAEGGRPGREFGILTLATSGYADQLDKACNTIRRYIVEYNGNPLARVVRGAAGHDRVAYTGAFIRYVGNRYCPTVGASNDPTGLNANWIGNVTAAYEQLLIA